MIEIRPGRRIKVAHYQQSSALPTLLFIHGLGGRAAQWREQLPALQANYNLVLPDLLGHGESEKPRSQQENLYSFEELSLDVEALFKRYASAKTYVLGHSYGGALAANLAFQYQEQIEKLILIAPVACQPFKQVPLIYFLPVSFLEGMRAYLDKSFEKLAFAREDSEVLLAEERKARLSNPMFVIKDLLMGMRRIPLRDARELTLPTLILGGSEDCVIPNASVAKFYGAMPRQETHVLQKAAHLVHLEQSARVNSLLASFIKEG